MTAHDYLNSFTNFESRLNSLSSKEFSLNCIEELLSYLDNPQNDLKAIHVAGTKGKGSTCAFISYILADAGYKVGLYTSPHLHRLNERIRILDKNVVGSTDDFYGMISDVELEGIINTIRPHVAALLNRGKEITYFEVMTVIALLYFKNANVDYVVLETGLGGRLDATNVVPAEVAVITPISFDHMHILGNTIAAIAAEKAGIIKKTTKQVVIAPQLPFAMDVIKAHCQEFGLTPVMVDGEFKTDNAMTLKGAHQRVNALVAAHTIEALKVFGKSSTPSLIDHAIAQTRWAGRFELLQSSPLIIADGAHNEASTRALVKAVQDYYPEHKLIVILAMSTDKDVSAVSLQVKPIADMIIVTKATHARAHIFSRQETHELFHPKLWCVTQNLTEAMEVALSKADPNHLILIMGSLFIVAEARKYLHVPSQK